MPRDFMRAAEEALLSDPTIAAMLSDLTPKRRRFPDGFRYRYYAAASRPRFRLWWCCWTTTRNENGKFVSFVYEWRGREAGVTREREHRKRNAAKARAGRLCASRTAEVRGTKAAGKEEA